MFRRSGLQKKISIGIFFDFFLSFFSCFMIEILLFATLWVYANKDQKTQKTQKTSPSPKSLHLAPSPPHPTQISQSFPHLWAYLYVSWFWVAKKDSIFFYIFFCIKKKNGGRVRSIGVWLGVICVSRPVWVFDLKVPKDLKDLKDH